MENPNYAYLLPFEIWRECFMLLSITEYKKLAQTCSYFYDICLPLIFKSITYSSKIVFLKRDAPRSLVTQLEKLREDLGHFLELAASRRHTHLVRKCIFVYSLRLGPSVDKTRAKAAKGAYKPFTQAFIKFLPAFINLREVQIRFSKNIDKKILLALASAPRLQAVSFVSVKFGAHQLKPLLNLRKLSIDNTEVDRDSNRSAKTLDLCSGEHLEDLSILSWVYAPKIFPALTKQGKLAHLTHLSFHLYTHDMQILYSFLASCPKLESIEMILRWSRDLRTVSLPPLPSSTIRHLQSFTGSYLAAIIFIPTRPVQRVRLTYDGWINRTSTQMEELFRHLSESTGPLTDLVLEPIKSSPDILAMITTHFSNLTRLCLGLERNRIFPDEDPHNISLPVGAIGAGGDLGCEVNSGASAWQAQRLHPVAIHAAYMNILHWTALRRISLPPKLETLCFETPLYYSDFLNKLDPNFYTIPMENAIFEVLSIHYPGLRRVDVGEDKMEKLSWLRDASGNWTYLCTY